VDGCNPIFSTLMFLRTPPSASIVQAETQSAAVLVNYNINPNWNLARPRRIISARRAASILLEGPGSRAWSVTIHPPFKYKFFFRCAARHHTLAPGHTTSIRNDVGRETARKTDQLRALIETGVLF